MKKILTALLCAAAVLLSADVLKEWNFKGRKVDGLILPGSKVGYRISPDVKTPEGEPCAEIKVRTPGKVPWELMVSFASNQQISKGMKLRYSFQIRGDRKGKMPVSCLQNQAPWKTIGNSWMEFEFDTEWKTVTREFTSNLDYSGSVRGPSLMAGKLPERTTLYIGAVKLEWLDNVLPLALNSNWTLFRTPDLKDVKLEALTAVPQTLGGVQGRTVSLKENTLMLAKPGESVKPKTAAVLFNEFESEKAGVMQVGCSADYWFEFMVNGKTVYDTIVNGNGATTYLPTDHVFNFPVKKGKNLIAVRVLSGSEGWRFVCGKVPFRAKLKQSRITRIVRGNEWRPVKMDKVSWDRKALMHQRIDQWKRNPGTALDLSQYVKKYDIDKCGWLKADAVGRLYFESAPNEAVRLRGFNFIPGGWRRGFISMSKPELEEFADQIALSGMNVLRFHFLDAFLVGNGGLPKQGKNRKTVSEVFMAQKAEELPVLPQFADRYWYFLKCLRDRGVYVMLDIFAATGMFTEAVKNEDSSYGRFQIFFNERYRNHWKAGFDYLLKTPNPYTGKALVDDPQLIAITCYNEQEHLLNIGGSKLEMFTPDWRKFRNPANPASVPEFSRKLIQSADPEGDAAREYLRKRLHEMNAFYLGVVKDSGFRGFVTNWDMFMRNLEGDARADFNAVSMHTYHAHPNKVKLYPPTFKQRLAFGTWLRGSMLTIDQGSSIVENNYIGRAAATRVFGKPFFMTEYSHCGYNRFAHEAAPMWAAYASLQDWQMLAPHSNTVKLYYAPFQPYDFDSGSNLSAVMNSLFCAFGWQRGDIRSAKHAVSFHVPEGTIRGPEYPGAIGSGYNALYMLTRIGSDYRNAENPAADLNIEPKSFVGAKSMGMYIVLSEERTQNAKILREQVAGLRKAGILTPANRTDAEKGIFESETGEICADVQKNTLTIDTPKFQSAVLKESKPVKLSDLSVESVSTPCTIAAISLENEKSIADSKHLLVVVGTVFAAENAVFSTENFGAELDVGDMQQVMRAGQFRFSLKNGAKGLPSVYALNMSGSRECKIPVTLRNGRVEFALDTCKLEYGTPYFEVVYP